MIRPPKRPRTCFSDHFSRPSARKPSGVLSVSALLGILLVTSGCCQNSGTSTSPALSDFCDRSREADSDANCSTTKRGSSKTPAEKEPIQFRANRFGGPYPCQQVRKKLNAFAAYQQAGVNYVDVCELTRELLVKSMKANQERAAKLRLPENVKQFQRYNYVISSDGRLLVAVWTTDSAKLKEIEKRYSVRYLTYVKGAIVDFGAEEQFAPTDNELPTGAIGEVPVPGAGMANKVGLFGASSEHFRIVQDGNSEFDAVEWMSSTAAYAGELIVDTAAKNAAGAADPHFYLNNSSNTFQPDAHYLRAVGSYVKARLSIAPRYLQSSHGGDDGMGQVWSYRVDTTSVIRPAPTP